MTVGYNLVVADELLRVTDLTETRIWARHLVSSYNDSVTLQDSFTQAEHDLASWILPAGNLILLPGDPRSVNYDIPYTINPDVLPPLLEAAGKLKGFRYIAAGIRKLVNWRDFFDTYNSAPQAEKIKLLSHAGHGSVSVLLANTPRTRNVSAQAVRVTIRRVTGSAALGSDRLQPGTTCKVCDLPASADPEALERHSVRCPNGGQRHFMHSGLVMVLLNVLLEAGVPRSTILFEMRGLRSTDRTRPGDVVALNFFGLDRHLVIDAVVSTVYRNCILQEASTVPGYAAKQAEDRKLLADKNSAAPVSTMHGGDHVFVPFSVEDGGRIGAHGLALLKALAEHAVSSGKFPLHTGYDNATPGMLVSLWVQRWQSSISSWLHVTLSRQLLRMYKPAGFFGLHLN